MTVKANPTGAFIGDTDTQNFTTGPKTFFDQTFNMRNRANTATLRFRGPTITSDADSLMNDEYDFLIFIDADDSNIIKAKRGKDQAIMFSHATDTGIVLNSVIAACANGAKISFLPGTYSGSTQHLNTNKKRIQYNGNGATITGFTFKLDGQSDTSSTGKCVFRNFEFNGTSAGVIVDNSHMTVFEYCFFNNNTVGLSMESSVKWSENLGLLYTNFQDCGTSLIFKSPTGTGTGSYINSSMLHCTFNNTVVNTGPFTYIKSESNTQIDEGKWFNNRLWFNSASSCTGMDFGGSCSRLMLFKPYFENFSGSTNTTGIILQSTVTGSPFPIGRPTFASSGTWAGKFVNASNKSIHGPVATWRQNHTITPSATANTYGTLVNCLTTEDWGGMPNMYVIIGGTVAAGETVSVNIATTTYSAVTDNITKTYTATGTYPLVLADYQALLTANFYTIIESIDVKAKSTATSTAATVTFIGFSGGTAASLDTLSPNTTLGDISYRTATTNTRLAGNTTTTKKFLRQTGDGTISAAPAWDTLVAGDLPTVPIAQGGTGQTTATLGFDALSPMTAVGDLIVGSTAGTRIRLPIGTANQAVKVNSGGTTLDYGTLPIAGGGTGAVTATAAFDALSSMTTLGDTQYGGASGTRTRLAGNTTVVKQYLSQTGDAVNSAAPAWATPKQVILFTAFYSSSNQTNNFIPLFGSLQGTTESGQDVIFDYAFTVKRFRFVVNSNAKTGTVPVSFRDDGADVTGTNITIGIGATGEFDSGALSVDVAAGSKLNFQVNATGSGASALSIAAMMIEAEMPLQ